MRSLSCRTRTRLCAFCALASLLWPKRNRTRNWLKKGAARWAAGIAPRRCGRTTSRKGGLQTTGLVSPCTNWNQCWMATWRSLQRRFRRWIELSGWKPRASDQGGRRAYVTSWTIARLLDVTADYLKDKGCESSRLDAELLLAYALGVERVQLYTEYDRPLSGDELDSYRELVSRRAQREPIAYILGHVAFRYLDLEVSPAVLIPRPETEELVEAVLDLLKRTYLPGHVSEPVVVDVGTGSGAIAFSLAQEAGIRVLALDISREALAVAERNRQALGLTESVILGEMDLLGGVPDERMRLVVSNPPYVASGDLRGLEPEVSVHEPSGALDAGPEGLDIYRRLVPEAARVLAPGGALFMEVGAAQAEAVVGMAEGAGFIRVDVKRDLAGHQRIVQATRPNALVASLQEATSPSAVDRLQEVVREGAILGVPTDTVLGLAAGWKVNSGVRRLFTVKGREEDRPMAVLFPSIEVVLEIPLVATSANPTSAQTACAWDDVPGDILSYCAVVLDSEQGVGPVGVASAVVDIRHLTAGRDPVVLREGAVSAAELIITVLEAAGR